MNSTPVMKINEFIVDDLSKSQILASRLATLLKTGDILTFEGNLGAGKTEFCRAIIHAVGYLEDVPSPTFNLVQVYEPDIVDADKPAIWHMDLYRLEKPEEIFELGIEEGFDTAITLIEWPDRMGRYLPQGSLEIKMVMGDAEGARKITFSGSEYWKKRLEGLVL